jgi:flagellar biosynthesis protein FlhF
MKIKTYVVDNINDAYPMIHSDLGKDAFILNTKPLRKSGLLGLFQKKQFEVVAAADDTPRAKEAKLADQEEAVRFEEMLDALIPNSKAITAEQDHAQKILEALKNNTNAQKQTELSDLKTAFTQATVALEESPVSLQNEQAVTPKKRGRPKKAAVAVKTEQELEQVQTPELEQAPELAQAPKKRGRPKKVQENSEHDPQPAKKRGRPKKVAVEEIPVHEEVLKELSEVKGLIQALAIHDKPSKLVPKLFETWVNQLRDHEVDEEVIQFIVKRVSLKHQHVEAISSKTIEQTFLEVIEQLFQEGIDDHSQTNEAFISLVGPTGVGKTTTIAKLAAAQVLERRQKVGLLTTDTFRIAAVEQLKTYATILNAPFKVVDQANELIPAMYSLKDCDVVFMDSAGRNYLKGEYVEEINQYLPLDVPQENYLVLSMTTRWRDMKKIVEQMKSVPIDKLILTKWDETTCYGAALNMVYHYPYPLSYLCLGQGVPDDIMKANPTFMAKKILGVDDSETGPSTSIKTII